MSLAKLLIELGGKLGFEARLEVPAADAAWVDVVWFDQRLSPATFGAKTATMRNAPVLPVVAFEIEIATGGNPKHVKGSVSNLNNLGAQLSVVVIGNASVAQLKKRTKAFAAVPEDKVRQILLDRVHRWVFAEAHPVGRCVIMSEEEVVSWAARHGVPPKKSAA